MADHSELPTTPSTAPMRKSKLRRIAEAPIFVGALAVVAFNELFNLAFSPAKMAIRAAIGKNISLKQLMDDLHHSEELLKESRLVKNITGRIWPWVPALLFAGLVAGFTVVGLGLKVALLLHAVPGAAAAMAKIPLVGAYIGTLGGIAKATVGLAVIGKIAKVPAIIIATCCPQFKDSWIHQKLTVPVLDGLKWIGTKSNEFIKDHTVGFRASIANLKTRIRESSIGRTVGSVSSAVRSMMSYVTPEQKEPKPINPEDITVESDSKIKAKAVMHTLLVYGGATAIPAATVMATTSAYGAASSLAIGAFAIMGFSAVGVAAAIPVGAAVLLGGVYGVANMSRRLFTKAAQGVCEVSRNGDIATAQAMHEGLLIGTVAAGGQHFAEHAIHATTALAGAEAVSGGLAMFGGYRKIHDEYRRINQAKREFLERHTANTETADRRPPRTFRDMFATSLPPVSHSAIRQRFAAVPNAVKTRLLARIAKAPVTGSDCAALHDHGSLRIAMKRLMRVQRPVRTVDAKASGAKHYRHA
ncbi:MAG: hypothetical protein SFW65_00645 [Alphaproteobacteria bacterium]|nr:hypothetical protein [Alphaproteobacteria bacterium]